MDKHYVVSNTVEIHWKPLEDAIGKERCGSWMYMISCKLDSGTVVHAYKHSIRRNYITLSDDGRVWKYDSGAYREVEAKATIAQAVAEAGTRGTE